MKLLMSNYSCFHCVILSIEEDQYWICIMLIDSHCLDDFVDKRILTRIKAYNKNTYIRFCLKNVHTFIIYL